MKPPPPFFDQLAAATAPEREGLLAVPQIRDGLSGTISLATYVAYLREAYHHVKHTVPLMQATRARLDNGHVRYVEALDEYIREETGHEQWILDDIRAAGGDADEARDGEPGMAVEFMVAYAYDFIARVNPMGFFGMVFVLEGVSTMIATQGATAVRASLGLPKSAFRYLTSHGAIDMEHIAFLRGILNSVEDEADRAAIIHMARRMFVLFAEVFRSIPHQGALAHAV